MVDILPFTVTSSMSEIPGLVQTDSHQQNRADKTWTYLNMGFNKKRHLENTFPDFHQSKIRVVNDKITSGNIPEVTLTDSKMTLTFGDLCLTPNVETSLEDEFQTFQKQMRDEVLDYIINQADNKIQQQVHQTDIKDGCQMTNLTKVDQSKRSKVPKRKQMPERDVKQSRLPIPVKENDKTVTIRVLVEVKASRLPRKLRSFVHSCRKAGGAKSKLSTETKRESQLNEKPGTNIDTLYRNALETDDGFKCRLPMPVRLIYPTKPDLPASRIPLAFSRFPNPVQVKKATLSKRVKIALSKQLNRINWKPKLNFPRLGEFFNRIRGSDKVMHINI